MLRRQSLRVLAVLLACSTGTDAAARSVARPALKLGGEWAGRCAAFSTSGNADSLCAQLITESWSSKVLHRRTIQPAPVGAHISTSVLPSACSGSTVLAYGSAMFEPDVLNARAWTIDAVAGDGDGECWTCETVFDGWGERPNFVPGAFDCPKERTRVRCTFDPASGSLASFSQVLVWQERCWSASPRPNELDEVAAQQPGGLDGQWITDCVGFDDFGATSGAIMPASSRQALSSDSMPPLTALSLGGGVDLRGRPGFLEISLTSGGTGSRNSYQAVIVKRSWAGDATGRSVFAEVETVKDMTGDK